MRVCSFPNCNNNVFSTNKITKLGYCRNHIYIVYKERSWSKGNQIGLKGRNGLKRSKIPLKKVSIKKLSNKRIIQSYIYDRICKQLTKDLKKEDKLNCFFCGEPINEAIKNINNPQALSYHHLQGRENELLMDKKWLVPSHIECHVWQYHSWSVKGLMNNTTWYNDFLNRLKEFSIELYEKEILKQTK